MKTAKEVNVKKEAIIPDIYVQRQMPVIVEMHNFKGTKSNIQYYVYPMQSYGVDVSCDSYCIAIFRVKPSTKTIDERLGERMLSALLY